jgi:hypothetical protein
MLKDKVRFKSPSLSATLLVGIVAALSQQYDEIMRRPKKILSVLIHSSELIFGKFHDSRIARSLQQECCPGQSTPG